MNILHLKYAVEIAKTKSISRAAENLYMGQPNLSRAIKELEDNLNITIFNRNSKGITITPEGEEFLQYARRIISQADRSSIFPSAFREQATLPAPLRTLRKVSEGIFPPRYFIRRPIRAAPSIMLLRATVI